jgi:3-hydroxyacyl-CoA dehydrogenase
MEMRQIKRVGVIGAGVMGAAIAAHLVNGGLDVLLLDVIPRELTGDEKARGLSLESPEVRNRIVNRGLEAVAGMRPAAFYLKEDVRRVEAGNLEDDMARLGECDWVIEAVIEDMEIKKQLFAGKVVPNLAAGAILSTNTSGLSVNEMAAALPPAVRRNFLVTHFFNPPRYLRLLEVVGCRETDPAVLDKMTDFLSRRLGKGVVHAKDTPNFIANRIGVYAIYRSIRHMLDLGMTVEEVDSVAGPATARPKSAAFRTADLVGIDTLMHVGINSYQLLPDDEERDVFKVPEFMAEMVRKGLLGNKTHKGFYRKEKGEGGSQTFYFDYVSAEYLPSVRPRFASVEAARQVDDPAQRLKMVVGGSDKAADFAWRSLRDVLIYTVNRIPAIADDIVDVDNAMRWGFNWELGPFEMLDAIGVAAFVERAERDGVKIPDLLRKVDRFYSFEGDRKFRYELSAGDFREIPVSPGRIALEIIRRSGGVVEGNTDCSLLDLGDGVFGLEFHSKMNTINPDILAMTCRAVARAEVEGIGLVIGNQGANFSAGANLIGLAGAIAEGAWDKVDRMVREFQQATLSLKYARIPVVAAPFNMTLGGGCEFCLHADAINAHAETYMGLVEIGVGLLPAGGGTKEMAIRAIRLADRFETDVSPFIFKNFQNIAMARVSTAAAELFGMGYLDEGDAISMNSDCLLADAKCKVIALARNYRPGRLEEYLKAPGRSVAASIKSQLWNLQMGGFITPYEAEIGGIIAGVITGGDVPAGTPVSEAYLLELEREGFLKLCGNRMTAERIEHMLKKGKPLRN